MDQETILQISQLYKSFEIDEGKLSVLEDINLSVRRGEFISIVGFSGCGKSTLLRILTGLEQKDSGIILLDGREVSGPGDGRGMIFQESRLFPWMKVKDNIRYGISRQRQKELGKEKTQALVNDYSRLVKLDGFENAKPDQLSGGMQQRVSIARSLISNPQILFLDEPLGALDAITRMEMQDELLRIHREDKTTMIMVTHDIDEAVYLSDRVVVLSRKPGRVKAVIDVPLSRPRRRTGIDFSEVRRQVYKQFFDEQADTDIEYMI